MATTWGDVIDKGFEQAKGYIDRSLEAVAKRFAGHDERLDEIEKRLAAMVEKPKVRVPAGGKP